MKQSKIETAAQLYREARTDEDFALAFQTYHSAFCEGKKEAAAPLGYLYERGIGCEKDLQRSEDMYRTAIEHDDDPLAICGLGRVLLSCEEYYEGISLLESAARNGVMYAHELLGQLYESERLGDPQPYRALEHYCEAADLGCNVGRYLAAGLLRFGDDTDVERAKSYLSIGCEENSGPCCWRLALMFYAKEGETVDVMKLASKAATLGVLSALEWCGQIYCEGSTHTPRDISLGEEMLRQAAERGSRRAKFLLGFYILKGTLRSLSHNEGENLCQEAAELGDVEAIRFVKDL